jgi:hypothetical protein
VARDPSGDANADGPDFLSANPRAGQPFHTLRGDAVIGADPNHHLFEIANVPMDIASIRTQIEDRIRDNLPGPVVRHITTAPRFMHFDALCCKLPIAGFHMRPAVATDAEGYHSWMLEQEQKIGNTPGTALLDERLLQREGVGIRNNTEPPDFEDVRLRNVSTRRRQSTPSDVSRRP